MISALQKTRVSFRSGKDLCAGILYRLEPAGGRLPCVVMGTGFGGTQDTPALTANAEDFARAGFAALTFDYRNFGESEGQPRQLVHIQNQLADFRAAITWARSQPGIDPDRIALWGTSLGGGHVISAAAADARIAAVVAQIPFNGFPKKVERAPELTRRLLAAMIKDTLRGWAGQPPHYIPAVGGADELTVMSSPEAKHVIEGMVSATWRNEVAPRALFDMMRYKPGAKASHLRMPVLVCIGDADKETTSDMASELAAKAPKGVLKSYQGAHFDFYRPDFRQRVTADQVAFLQEHLAQPAGSQNE